MDYVVIPDGFEPSTPALKVRCSSQLSYEIMVAGLGLEPRTSAYETDEMTNFYASRNLVEVAGLEPAVPEGNDFTDRAATNYRLHFHYLAVRTGFEPVIFRVTGGHQLLT
jgi:hypothetical protein